MRVLFLARHFSYLRLFESAIAELAERGHAIHLSTDREESLGGERWTLSAGQLIDIVKWNLLCHIPVKMRGAEDDEEETTKSFTSV